MFYTSWSELSEKLKNGIKILVGQVVLELLIKTLVCMLDQLTHEPLGLLQDAYIIFQDNVDHFEIMHKTCSTLV